jgi:hypothetical protein
MGLITVIVHLVYSRTNHANDAQHADTLTQIPQTITAALAKFNLDGRTTIYAVCPVCHCTYKPSFKSGSLLPIYPERCTNKPKPQSGECAELLLQALTENGSSPPKPIKPFVYHHFHDYLAGLLSRPDLEALMDKSCDDLMQSLLGAAPSYVKDVFEADFLRTFEGPEPHTLFVNRKGNGRYTFSLNVDFFNVEGLRVRGASTSCGIMSMACLNLPLDIRFRPENMYLAIIPGPKEPHLTI